MLSTPHQESHACDAQDDPNSTCNSIHRREVHEAEEVRKRKCGDNREYQAKALAEVLFRLPLPPIAATVRYTTSAIHSA